MKTIRLILIIFALLTISRAFSSPGVNHQIVNKQAQILFDLLTNVQSEGAAGHIYKRGKNILCWRINAGIDDNKGNPIPLNDPRRYKCSIHIDSFGHTTPGQVF